MAQPEGYLFVDHRASPGIPEEQARTMGLDPALVKEGKVMEAATLRCCGCHGQFIKNPLRTRERAFCFQCNSYMCDACAALGRTRKHVPFVEVIEKVASGKFEWKYGPDGIPVLTPTGENSNG